MCSPSVRRSSCSMSPTTSLTSTTSGWTTSRRANASSWWVRHGRRSPARWICATSRAPLPALVTSLGGGFELLADERRVVDDHRQQVVEVVGDPAGELPKALQAMGLLHLVLHLAHARRRPAGAQRSWVAGNALADFADRGDREQAVFGLDARQADLGRKLAAVTATTEQPQPGAHRPRARILEVARPVPSVRCAQRARAPAAPPTAPAARRARSRTALRSGR